MTDKALIKRQVNAVIDQVSPYHRTELKVLLEDDPETAYIKAQLLSGMYWNEDINEYSLDDCSE